MKLTPGPKFPIEYELTEDDKEPERIPGARFPIEDEASNAELMGNDVTMRENDRTQILDQTVDPLNVNAPVKETAGLLLATPSETVMIETKPVATPMPEPILEQTQDAPA